MGGTNIVPFKCEICGCEGQAQSFRVCPECHRIIGRECWQPKFQKASKDDSEYSNCKHCLHGPIKTIKAVRVNQ